MRAALVFITLLIAALTRTSSATAVWTAPICSGCCSYTTSVGSSLSIPLRASRVNGSMAAVTIFPQEDPGLPIGSILESQLSNASLAVSALTFTPLALHKNLSLVFFIHAFHDSATALCISVSVRAPAPFYAPDSLNASTNFTAAVNCPVTLTIAVQDAFYPCSVRLSRMSSISPTGATSASIPNHTLQPLSSVTRHSLTLTFVPVFGSESSSFTACFVGSDALGLQPLAEVCVTWTVTKCEYCSASGETLQYIAQLYSGDANWRRLFNMNPSLRDPDLIFTDNKRLVIGNVYRIARGDTLTELGRRFKCSLPSLLRLNPDIQDPASISVGQLLCVAPYTALAESDARLGARVSN